MKITDAKRTDSNRSKGVSVVLFVFVIIAIVAFPLSVVWKQIAITNVSVEYVKLQKMERELESEIVSLNLRRSEAISSKRIESIATQKLGMVFPNPREIVVINENKKQKGLFCSDQNRDGIIAVLARSLKPNGKS